MFLRLVVPVTVIVGALGTAGQAVAQTCPNGAPRSAAGICPVFFPGDPSCADAFQVCGFPPEAQIVVSPPRSVLTGSFRIEVTAVGAALDVKDVSPVSQQNGTRGMEILVARRNGAYIYCGTSLLHDVVRAPGTGSPSQLSVCWAKGPCGLDEVRVGEVCTRYNPAGSRTADFLQAYLVGPLEQSVNLCGCSPAIAQFCDARQPILDTEGNPAFVACNPDGSPLKSAEAESIATEGTDTCIWMTIGGRRILVDKDGTDPKC
jgi:hypothetical protein